MDIEEETGGLFLEEKRRWAIAVGAGARVDICV